MPRVKRGVTARARHKKVLVKAKGFTQRRNNVFRIAKDVIAAPGSACSARSGLPASTRRCASTT